MSICRTTVLILVVLYVTLHQSALIAAVGGGPFVYGLLHGGKDDDAITDVAVLADGAIAVCGWLTDTSPWSGSPGWKQTVQGGTDAFVAVLESDLKTVRYFTTVGGRSNDRATALVTDPLGNIIVVGWTLSNDFPTTVGSASQLYSAHADGFVVCFTPKLDAVTFSLLINGSGDELPTDVNVDEHGSVFVCGSTTSANGFPVINGLYKNHFGGMDGFVLRLSPNGGTFMFSTYFGGTSNDSFTSLELDNSGNIYLSGWTSSADYPMYPSINTQWWWYYSNRPYDWTFNGGDSDATLTVLSQDGARGISSTYFGGAGNDVGTGVAFSDGNALLTGYTTSYDLPQVSAYQGRLLGSSDMFMAEFKDQGRTLTVSSYLGGSGADSAAHIVAVQSGMYAITGISNSQDFPVAGYHSNPSSSGGNDAVLVLTSGKDVSYATLVGGAGNDVASRLAILPNGGVVIVGTSASTTIELSSDTLKRQEVGESNSAFAVIVQRGAITLSQPSTSERMCEGSVLRVQWTQVEMLGSDRFDVELSSDLKTWTPIASQITGNNIAWTIQPIVPLNASYYVRVTSARGHASRTELPLRFDIAPVVVVQPQSTVVLCPNTQHVLRGKVIGTDLSYQWLYNGSEIDGATTDSLEIGGHGRLQGQYTLRYRAGCGMQGTTATSVVSIGTNLEIIVQPSSDTVYEGSRFELNVQAVGTNLRYQWFKNGQIIQGGTQSRLVVPHVVNNDAGIYTCLVTSDCGQAESQGAILVVKTPVTSVPGSNNVELILFPNPTHGKLMIRIPENHSVHRIMAYTVAGSMAREWVVQQENAVVQVSLDGLAPGLYIVRSPDEPKLSGLVVFQP